MRTIGFYSFKGGVGRTNLVLNVAYHLAKAGRHVGMMDLDLEAPGLTVAPPLARPTPNSTYPDKGITDFLQAAVKALPNADKGKQKDIELPDIKDIFYQTQLAHQWSGSIHLAPAVSIPPKKDSSEQYSAGKVMKHRAGSTYTGLIRKNRKQKLRIGERIFNFLRDHIGNASFRVVKQRSKNDKPKTTEHKFDYLLVDLRTGLTELSDTAIGTLLSELVIVCGLNTQNTEGLYTTLHNIENLAGEAKAEKAKKGALKMPIRITPVFSPVPNGEIDRVRARFKVIYKRLLSISKKWFDAGDQLQLLVGIPGNSASFSDHSSNDVPLYKIHYCDYLSVGDKVLLEAYPETQAAQEILSIAQRYTKKPEEYAAQTQTALKNMGVFLDMALDGKSASGAWNWVFTYFKKVPDWRWPLHVMGADDFDKKAFAHEFMSTIVSKDNADEFIRGLAASVSSATDVKNRIIKNFSKLSEAQISELLKIFREEQKKFSEFDEQHAYNVGVLALEHFRQWADILAEAGAKFALFEKWLPRVSEKKDLFSPLPLWAFYLAYISAKENESKIRITAFKHFFQCSDLPPQAVVTALKNISRDMPPDFKNDLEKILEQWTKQLADKNIPAAVSYQIAKILRDDLSLYRHAETMYGYALEANPNDANIYNSLGILLADHLSRFDEAESAYKQALKYYKETNRAYGYYNFLRLLTFRLKKRADYNDLLADASRWLDEEPLLLENNNLNNIHAALMALCKKDHRVKNILTYLQKKATDTGDILWLQVIACTIGETKAKDIAPYTPQSLAADELEETIQLTAMLQDRILIETNLSHLKTWFTNALKCFIPPDGSRELHLTAIAPFAAALNIEIPDDMEAPNV